MKTQSIIALVLAAGLAAVLPSFAIAQAARGGDLITQGVTQPSRRVELAFSFQGIILKVDVKDGDTVKAGQELMRQATASKPAASKA